MMTVPVDIVLVLNGRKNDRGFVQEGYDGAVKAAERLNLILRVQEHTSKEPLQLESKVRKAAQSGARGVIVHGSRADAPLEAVAPDFPHVSFLSPGGYAAGANVWNYAVRHYEAAFLAGALAARMTKTGIVGHLSGVPIAPGKRGRAAFVDGVRQTDPQVTVVTGFCGDQDKPELARLWVEAQADVGIDILFTMLNFGRTGAIDACRNRGIKQIGNIRDWTREEPDVFVGSAIARHGWSIGAWMEDLQAGALQSGVNKTVGLDEPSAVDLVLSATVDGSTRERIAQLKEDVIAGRVSIAETYDGPEFHPGKAA